MAQTVRIEDVDILVPPPSEYFPLTDHPTRFGKLASDFAEPLDRLALFLDTNSIREVLSGQMPKSPRQLSVHKSDSNRNTRMSVKDFQLLKQSTKSSLEVEVEAGLRDGKMVTAGAIKRLSEREKIAVSVSIPRAVVLKPHFESERALSFTMLIETGSSNGSQRSVTNNSVSTCSLILVRGKVMSLFANSLDPMDLNWSRQVSADWVKSILSANPDAVDSALNQGSSGELGTVLLGLVKSPLVFVIVAACLGAWLSRITSRKNR